MDPVAEVLEIDRRRIRAMLHQDADALTPLLADDLIYIHASSSKDSKASYLSALLSGALLYRKVDHSEVEARAMGDWVLLTGKTALAVFAGSRRDAWNERFTAIYVRRGQGWQLYCWQATRLPQNH